jgi:stress response protein YsnF
MFSSGHQGIYADNYSISKHDIAASFLLLSRSLITNHRTFRRYEVLVYKETDKRQAASHVETPHTRLMNVRKHYRTTRRHVPGIVIFILFIGKLFNDAVNY